MSLNLLLIIFECLIHTDYNDHDNDELYIETLKIQMIYYAENELNKNQFIIYMQRMS